MNRQRKTILRSVACVGAAFAVILSAGNIDSRSATNASFATQTSLAGISLSLDESYTSAEINIEENKEEAIYATDSKVLGADTADYNTETELAEDNQEVSSRFENVGISIADDYVFVRTKPSVKSKAVGKLYRGCTAKILEDKGNWVEISSGNVKGYIKKEFLDIGIGVEDMVDEYGTKWATVTATGVRVREKASEESGIVTLIPEGVTYKVLKEENGWVKIHINGSEDEFCPDSCNGWVLADLVEVNVEFKHAVSIEEERAEARRKARAKRAERRQREWLEEQAARQDNDTYYEEPEDSYEDDTDYGSDDGQNAPSGGNSDNSGNGGGSSNGGNGGSGNSGNSNNSDSDGGSSDDIQAPVGANGAQIAAYACQFAGGPYVYGGTSLTNGCDCSGLCYAVYRDFGISIPRSSYEQAASGTPVSLDELQPGDLVFYASGGTVNHAALYIGGGQVIQASDYSTGIIYSPVNYRTPYCARRYW